MKYILVLFTITPFFSCSEDEEKIQSSVKIRINHYQQSAIGEATKLVLLTQEGNMIGTDEWLYHYSEINGFNFEWGFVF